ncbi:MAG: curli production assembly protein CsgG [Acidobacteriaceae bacterium]|nr:curli production assembly protein CsgG [Acidobacteriaceae bacterium]
MKIGFAILSAALFALPVFSQQPPSPDRKKVAILDFNYATVMTSVQAVFGTNQDIGKGISDLLVNQLVNDGTYRVIERAALDKILKEQNFSNSDRADPNSAAKIGKILGVDAIITGDITQFGRDDQNRSIGGGGLSNWGAKYGIGNIGTKKAKAVVEITARVIDVNTAEILASTTGHGESSRSGTDLLGGGGSWGGAGGGHVDMGSSNFGQTIIGEAVKGAVTQLGSNLDAKAAALPHTVVQINGVVADATGNTLIINVGSKSGLHVGDRLAVTRVTRVIKDPVTGKPLRSVADSIGQMQVTSVDEDSAVGTFTGTGQPQVGDAVKNLDH